MQNKLVSFCSCSKGGACEDRVVVPHHSSHLPYVIYAGSPDQCSYDLINYQCPKATWKKPYWALCWARWGVSQHSWNASRPSSQVRSLKVHWITQQSRSLTHGQPGNLVDWSQHTRTKTKCFDKYGRLAQEGIRTQESLQPKLKIKPKNISIFGDSEIVS